MMVDHAFQVTDPIPEWDGGWWVLVRGQHTRRHGPFPDSEAAVLACHHLFQRWAVRARALGGWAWRRTHREWVVTLPRGVPCLGQPFRTVPVSSHTGDDLVAR